MNDQSCILTIKDRQFNSKLNKKILVFNYEIFLASVSNKWQKANVSITAKRWLFLASNKFDWEFMLISYRYRKGRLEKYYSLSRIRHYLSEFWPPIIFSCSWLFDSWFQHFLWQLILHFITLYKFSRLIFIFKAINSPFRFFLAVIFTGIVAGIASRCNSPDLSPVSAE